MINLNKLQYSSDGEWNELEYGKLRKLDKLNRWELIIQIPDKPIYHHLYKSKERALLCYRKYMGYHNRRVKV